MPCAVVRSQGQSLGGCSRGVLCSNTNTVVKNQRLLVTAATLKRSISYHCDGRGRPLCKGRQSEAGYCQYRSKSITRIHSSQLQPTVSCKLEQALWGDASIDP